MSFLVRNFLGAAAPPPPSATAAVHHPVQHSQVQILVNRVQTSSVAQDRRDAIAALCEVEGAGRQLTPDNVGLLVNVTKMHLDDPDFLLKAVELFSNITDEAQVPDFDLRAAFIDELMNVDLFLNVLKDGHFWARYNAVQLLQRLQQHDDSAVVKQLLANRGVQPLIDILNDGSNGGALRNEGLVLLSNLTAINHEVQTILAFENCFETLFNITEEEGGVEGDIIVKDCLMVMNNMLRTNQAAQKLFLELSIARLTPLIRDCTPSGRPLTPNGNSIVHGAIVVATSVLRCGDSNGNGAAARTSLCHSGALAALASVAFTTNALDAHVPIEALRTIGLILHKHKQSCDQFLNLKLKHKQAQVVPAPWLALKVLLYDGDDAVRQFAALHAVAALLNDGGANAAAMLTRGVVPHSRRNADHGLQCGQLIGGSLFSATPSSGSTTFYAAWILSRCVAIPQVAEQLLHVPWEDGLTFFTAFVHLVTMTIQQRKADMATIASMMRPLFVWVSYTANATVMLLADPAQHKFFADWSAQSRDPPHVKLLCAAFHAHVCAVAPTVKQPSMQVTRDDLRAYFTQRIGLQRLNALVFDVSASAEWQGAPADVTTAQHAAIFDASYKSMIDEIVAQAKVGFEDAVAQQQQPVAAPASRSPSPQPAPAAVLPSPPPALPPQPVPQPAPQPAPPQNEALERELRALREQLEKERAAKAEAERRYELLRHSHEEAERLFEETLAAKDSELRGLVDSMSLLETRLVTASETTQTLQALETDLQKLRVDREDLLVLVAEMDEENQLLRQAHESSGISIAAVDHSAEKAPRGVDEEEDSLI